MCVAPKPAWAWCPPLIDCVVGTIPPHGSEAGELLVFLVMGKTPKENSEHCSKNRATSKFGYCSRHCSSQGLRNTVAKTEQTVSLCTVADTVEARDFGAL